MATIGVSKPYVAKYSDNEDGTASYMEGARLALATQLSATIETGENNVLYADNGAAESNKSFSGGTLTIGVDELSQQGSKLILGLQENKITVDGEEVSELVYDDDAAAPYLGFGCIVKKMKSNSTKWRAVVFTKVQFAIPEDAATTQGEAIEWQTPSLEATIMRDDTAKHTWKREATFDSEAKAEAYIKQCLGIQEAALGQLTVTSAAGANTGDTKLTVAPAKAAGNSYKYKTGEALAMPAPDQVCGGEYTDWDGAAEITAATGQKIMVVEVDGENRAKKAGTATVTAKA